MAKSPAMSSRQVESALYSGDDAARRAVNAGCRLFIGGDMGIGNTTSAAALACALLGQQPTTLVGPGTGLNSEGVARSEERRVGKECRSRWSPYDEKKNKKQRSTSN